MFCILEHASLLEGVYTLDYTIINYNIIFFNSKLSALIYIRKKIIMIFIAKSTFQKVNK